MTFSIIIPHYNTPEFLERLLQSIPDEARFQTLVVDDASQDRAKLEAVCANRTNTELSFAPAPNKSAGRARNQGLARATGDWVLFADSDDFFPDGALDALASLRLDSSVDIHFARATSVNAAGEIGQRHKNVLRFLETYVSTGDETGIRYRWGPPWGKVYNRAFLNQHNITFDEIEAANDVMFCFKAGLNAATIRALDLDLYVVRERGHSLTTQTTPSRALCRLEVLTRYNELAMNAGLSHKLYSGNRYFVSSLSLVAPGRRIKAYAAFAKMKARKAMFYGK
jgi:glycosyltransferase involved in cell wall biosynthesis